MLDLDFKDYLRLTGWILVFLFPIWVVYKTGGPEQEPLLDDIEYQRRQRLKKLAEQKKRAVEPDTAIGENAASTAKTARNRKKNKKSKAVAPNASKSDVKTTVPKTSDDKSKADSAQDQLQTKQSKKDKKKKTSSSVNNDSDNSTIKADFIQTETQDRAKNETVKEIDEHMDPTARYARVMRIKPEEEALELDPVPFEEGWNQVKSRRSNQKSSASNSSTYIDTNAASTAAVLEANERYIPGLDKKQRENMKRNAKKKAQKQASAALQEERLRKHKKELEKIKIQEYYATGKGKNTPWGKNGQKSSSSKVPQSTASINEYGQLIWD